MTDQADAIHVLLSVMKDGGLLRSVNEHGDGEVTLTFADHTEASCLSLGRVGEPLADAALSWRAMEAELV